MGKTVKVEILFSWMVPVQDADIDHIMEELNEYGDGNIVEVVSFLEDDDD